MKTLSLSSLAFVLIVGIAPSTFADPKFKCEKEFKLADFEGTTFLDMMTNHVQQAMNEVAAEGHIDNNKALETGRCVTVQVDAKNYTWHVNFAEGSEKGGRSFGFGPGGKVSDPSDAAYLNELEKISNKSDKEVADFNKALIKIIANNDASGYKKLKNPSQVVATDFVAIYVAEEKRHLVSDLGAFQWDDALLQVTLLASFHGNQKEYAQFYEGSFTNQVPDQNFKGHTYKQGNLTEETPRRQAKLVDYWQWNHDRTRSGINMTRSDFTALAKAITAYERENNADKLEAVEKLIGVDGSTNIYSDIAKFFISKDAPKSMAHQSDKLAEAISDLLTQVRDDADLITDSIDGKPSKKTVRINNRKKKKKSE